MSGLQRIVQIFGVAFVLVAALGLAAGGLSTESSMDHATRLLGIFPVNLPHNLVHLLFGVAGLAAAARWSWSLLYARMSGVAYLLLVPVGLFSPTLGGLMPIGGSDIILHAVLGAVLTLVGLAAEAPAKASEAAPSLA